MTAPSPLGRPARRSRGRSPLELSLIALAVLWLGGGLVGAVRYVDSYAQYRGFAPPSDPAGVPRGRLLHQTFFSAALGRQASYLVYLPPGYDRPAARSRRFPTLYLLHGSPGYPEAFLKIAGLGVRLDVLVRAGRIAPMMLVMPDGRIGGNTFSESEWANGARGRYADFVLDVVADVDRRLRTRPARTARVLAGYSEGGYGAVNLGLHHPAVFAGIEAWSGYYVQGHSGTFAKAPQAVLDANSPLDYASGLGPLLAHTPLRVFLYTGRGDPQAVQMAPLVAELRAVGAQADAAVYPGAHDWGLWHTHAGDMLAVADRDFAQAPRLSVPLSAAAAGRALRAGRAAAAQARRTEHLAAILHHRQVASCQANASIIESGAGGELARLSPRGLRVVNYHVVANCLNVPPGPGLLASLCRRLPDEIGIEHRSARRHRHSITARCLRTVAGQVAHG